MTAPTLREALVAAEDMLDRQNDFPCIYCRASAYDGEGGVRHNAGCVIKLARAALSAAPEQPQRPHEDGGCRDDGCPCWRNGQAARRPVGGRYLRR